METIFYPDEIRSPASLNTGIEAVQLNDNEMKMAVNLIQNLSSDFDPAKYQDEYREALWEMIQSKVSGQEVVVSPASPNTANVVDLMEALKASVELAESKRKASGTKKPGRRKKTGS